VKEIQISIIVPCYNEGNVLNLFFTELNKEMLKIGRCFEILFINDGSTDDTLCVIKNIVNSNKNVKYYSFSRNFGKESAMYEGLCNANGEYVVVMDADMQDPPSLLNDMITILDNEDIDCVATRRIDRKGEPIIRSWFARKFYHIMNKVSDADIVDGARDFRIMKRPMVEAVKKMSERNRFSKGIFGWIGFRTKWISYDNVERVAGETKWSFWKLTKYAVDGIINFSEMPLNIASWIGIISTIVSVLALIFIIIRKLIFGDPVDGWASTVCVIIFIGGIQLFCMGIMGQYIAKTYSEVKNRPHYIISESNDEESEKIN